MSNHAHRRPSQARTVRAALDHATEVRLGVDGCTCSVDVSRRHVRGGRWSVHMAHDPGCPALAYPHTRMLITRPPGTGRRP